MALKSTVFKSNLNVANLDTHIYGDFPLTIARHPSETDQRMMLRLLAFALHASSTLAFGRGISTDDEPDIWDKDLSGNIDLWIDLGLPDPSRLRKACGRAKNVVLYAYGDRAIPVWLEKHKAILTRCSNLRIWQVSDSHCLALGELAKANMALQCTITDGEVLISDGQSSIAVACLELAY